MLITKPACIKIVLNPAESCHVAEIPNHRQSTEELESVYKLNLHLGKNLGLRTNGPFLREREFIVSVRFWKGPITQKRLGTI